MDEGSTALGSETSPRTTTMLDPESRANVPTTTTTTTSTEGKMFDSRESSPRNAFEGPVGSSVGRRMRRESAGSRSNRMLNGMTQYIVHSFAGLNRMAFPDDTHDIGNFARGCFAEFWGTTFLVYIGCGSAVATGTFLVQESSLSMTAISVSRILPIATAFGIVVTALVFALAHISGAHINPAITFGLLLMERISLTRAIFYIACQVLGGILGAALLWGSCWGLALADFRYFSGTNAEGVPFTQDRIGDPPFFLGANMLSPFVTEGNGLLYEIMGTCLLILVVLLTAVDQRSFAASNLIGISIGFAVWVDHIVLIPFTGCGINPARSLGPAIVNSIAGTNTWTRGWWIYYVGPAVGSIFAVVIVRLLWEGSKPPSPRFEELREAERARRGE